jgi:hypothetical protein
MTGRTRKDIVKHVAESWFDLFGAHGRPTPRNTFAMLDSLREKHADIDTFIEVASDDELTSAMLAVHEYYDGMERAQKMVEKEYAL